MRKNLHHLPCLPAYVDNLKICTTYTLSTNRKLSHGRWTGAPGDAYLRFTMWEIPRRRRNLAERMRSGIFKQRVSFMRKRLGASGALRTESASRHGRWTMDGVLCTMSQSLQSPRGFGGGLDKSAAFARRAKRRWGGGESRRHGVVL